MKYLTKKNLIFIFILALTLRLVFVTKVPPAINWDEASLGVNAYSILKTGKDEWGRVMPVTFEAFGDYKLPGYVYTAVPFIAVFGLSEFAVRLPSVLFGSLSVIFLYLLVFELTKDKKWAYLSAILLAISPWHFFLSRIALEANLALSFFLLGFYLLIYSLKKNALLVPASILLGLSIFTYNSARIFIPVFLLVFIFMYCKNLIKNNYSIFSALIFGLFLTAGFYFALFQDSSARYYWVKILDEGAINFLEQSRNNSTFSPLFTELIYNRVTYFVFTFVSNYLKHLSIQFLAISGGSNYQFSLQNFGLMYFIELPFLLYGFYKLIGKKTGWIFLSWLLIAPIPASLTREAPHALRSIFMLGSIQIITAYGLIQLFLVLKKNTLKKIAVVLIIFLIFINSFYYSKTYFKDYPVKYSQAWQYGYKQAVEIILRNYENYPKIYFTKKYGEPHIFYLLFSKYDPSKYQKNPSLVRYEKSNWRWVDRLDKVYFVNDWEIKDILKDEENALLITSPTTYPETGELVDTIYFLDGSKAFEIVKI